MKVMLLLVLASVLIGSSFGAPQFLGRPGGFRRPGFGGGGFGGPGKNSVHNSKWRFARHVFYLPTGFGGANAGGFGNGFAQNNQAVGTGTGIANAGPGIIHN